MVAFPSTANFLQLLRKFRPQAYQ